MRFQWLHQDAIAKGMAVTEITIMFTFWMSLFGNRPQMLEKIYAQCN